MLKGESGRVIKEIQDSQATIYICFAMAFVYCCLYIYAMSRWANCLAMFAVLLLELTFCGGAAFAIIQRGKYGAAEEQTRDAYLYTAIGLIVGGVIYNLLLCCFWR